VVEELEQMVLLLLVQLTQAEVVVAVIIRKLAEMR
jgi:hypothetical protein